MQNKSLSLIAVADPEGVWVLGVGTPPFFKTINAFE